MAAQTLVSELAVKALDKRILRGLSWLDKAQRYTGLAAPEEHCLTSKLSAVIANYPSRFVAALKQLIQESRHLSASDRDRNQLPDHLAREVIHHILVLGNACHC